jgi:alpha-tubulin N-acetyltransferase 1
MEIMDSVGSASAAAQNLHQIITSSDKLRSSDGNQSVYFFCDFATNQVIGLLKVGKKKLFVYDQAGVQHEMNPLCILDFYIHESRQRVGCGKVLFETMLKIEGANVEHLAIDRPSDKFLFFLRKHYELTNIIPQVNNFVIFDGFFKQRSGKYCKIAMWSVNVIRFSSIYLFLLCHLSSHL